MGCIYSPGSDVIHKSQEGSLSYVCQVAARFLQGILDGQWNLRIYKHGSSALVIAIVDQKPPGG